MVRKLLFTSVSLLFVQALFAQSALKGKVVDKDTKEVIPFANVVIESESGNRLGGASSDIDGMYTIKPIPAGKINVKASCIGYGPYQMNGVQILADKIQILNIDLSSTTKEIQEVVIQSYKNPLISADNTQTGVTVTSEDIAKMAARSTDAIAIQAAGVYSENGEVGSIHGARASGNVTYIDNMKVIGNTSLPKSAIEEETVITGGLDAKYGDATGGITNITTKGASSELYGGVEFLTSQYLDPYGYNLLGVTLSGPLWTIDDKSSPGHKNAILGYFFSGEVGYVKDGSPSAISLYQVKDDVRQQIIDNPLRALDVGSGTNLNAEFLHSDAFEKVNVKKNADNRSINLSGKIDISPSKNLGIVIGLSANSSRNENWNFSNSLFNWDNNSESYNTTMRGYVRLTQKFPNSSDEKEKSLISNVYYYIQADYERDFGLTWDKHHQNNLFDYGYMGRFQTYKAPSYSTDLKYDSITGLYAHIQDNNYDTLVKYTYSNVNPYLANYTQRYFDLFGSNHFLTMNPEQIQFGKGLLNGDAPDAVYSIWYVPGAITTGYSKYDDNQFRVSASGSADIKDHAISFGFEFEKRTYNGYNVAPYGLWTLARGLMNKHIQQLDVLNPIPDYLKDQNGNYVYNDDGSRVFMDTISYNRLYSAQDQALFDIKFRQHLGKPINGTEWVDLDSYDPSQLSINYFAADELYNSGNSYVSYMGYDPYGNLISRKPSLQDFFSASVSDGGKQWPTRLIAPYEPNYSALYLQDKFSFNDLIFNVGVRVDRFDANQKVLKDPYTLYDAFKAGDSDGGKLLGGERPSNIGDNYTVYVDNVSNPTRIMGYRNGSTWFNSSGTEINDPQTIASASGIAPYLVKPDVTMSSDNYDVSMSFKNYEPQITVMPRISFSFPISDVATFYAHYDVLSTRPGDNVLDPSNYLFFQVRSAGLISNPDLKPEKTVDYALGFQQKLNATSALKLEAYYRDMRDMIQQTMLYGAYPEYRYRTYSNIDFGTVKGFTVTYDLRRTGNVTFRGSYTLQFANGTGSNADAAASLVSSFRSG
ncbi:MAG: carboxypeptidase-like regulatory domain-containing protein [Bacteroidia bacterium]|nr:carboxypeptidase-like regulatory domain-containing protein [Bacteroidia bacterium]